MNPLVVKYSKYQVTKAGYDFLKCYGGKNFEKEKPLNVLEVWTEADLEKLAHERALKNK